ncbi:MULTISPECIES: Hpt domain-containing protein [Rhodobacterales]|jgi:HPt (histidine-containing phosphotransfer) domain-containing protein|uniref:Hpt domain-containing protein n=1 Tax=Ascidiaceihabitans sp. TaxID=1872644 RepID=UPI00329852CB
MIDWSQVKSLRADVGPEDFDEVVELFLEEVEEVVTRLKQDADVNELENDLHFLKGSAMNLGFSEFSALCQDGELRAAEGRGDEINLSKVVECYAVSKIAFVTDLPQVLH